MNICEFLVSPKFSRVAGPLAGLAPCTGCTAVGCSHSRTGSLQGPGRDSSPGDALVALDFEALPFLHPAEQCIHLQVMSVLCPSYKRTTSRSTEKFDSNLRIQTVKFRLKYILQNPNLQNFNRNNHPNNTRYKGSATKCF